MDRRMRIGRAVVRPVRGWEREVRGGPRGLPEC